MHEMCAFIIIVCMGCVHGYVHGYVCAQVEPEIGGAHGLAVLSQGHVTHSPRMQCFLLLLVRVFLDTWQPTAALKCGRLGASRAPALAPHSSRRRQSPASSSLAARHLSQLRCLPDSSSHLRLPGSSSHQRQSSSTALLLLLARSRHRSCSSGPQQWLRAG